MREVGKVDVGPSCLLESEVQEIAKNAGIPRRGDESGMQLLHALHAHYGTRMGNEVEWLHKIEDPSLAAQLQQTAFRPMHPTNWLQHPTQWLSDADIMFVLSQYEMHLGDSRRFKFIGVFPSDFADDSTGTCVSPAMCQVDVKELVDAGIHNIAMVFNMDKHHQPGSHWVACYIGLDPTTPLRYGAFYYDSVARPPPASIAAFMARIKAETEDDAFPVRHNTERKQFKTTECGVYAALFVILCLNSNLTIEQICRDVIKNDDETNLLRRKLFRSPEQQ